MKISGKPNLLEFISTDSLKQKSSLRAAVSIIYTGLEGWGGTHTVQLIFH